ncbi:polyprenyl synthetase family protein [Amycolatopsis sp. GM8]|uniref:polyprenyl synthetase family protein n=1 Tax=Amycolatopsis sp. GM8 TaxID=2896530 RepID=UPI001F34DBBD|nr:polyprenyl synthetase family protein [Amycolatopsis sp. GM8]
MSAPGLAKDLAAVRAAALPVLRGTNARLVPTLRETVDLLSTKDIYLGRIVGYHLGFNDAAGNPEPGDAGGLGGTMCLAALAAKAAGATDREIVTAAAAIELAKDFTQLQDDIIDNDTVRRERPSAWASFGVPRTVLAADAAKAAAFELLAAHGAGGAAATAHLMAALDRCTFGQAQDISAETRPFTGSGAMTLEDFRGVARNKTCSILACTYSLGAVLAAAPPDLVTGLAGAGHSLGMAWQVLDDLLDLWGGPADALPYNDLRQGKKTFPLLAALGSGHPAAEELRTLLETGLTEGDLPRAATLIERAGGRDATEAEVRRRFTTAITTLGTLPIPAAALTDLTAVSSLIGTRGSNKTITVAFPSGEVRR